MRRTLALAGAAVLAVGLGGLAGPASADTGIAQQEPEVVMSEISVDLGSLEHDFEGGFIELHNPSTDPSDVVSLQGYKLEACSATGPLELVFDAFTSAHAVLPGGYFLIADVTYRDGDGPVADIEVESLGLEQAAGGVILTDTNASLDDSIRWDSPQDSVCADFPDAGASPDGDDSINRASPSWDPLTPTPQNSSS